MIITELRPKESHTLKTLPPSPLQKLFTTFLVAQCEPKPLSAFRYKKEKQVKDTSMHGPPFHSAPGDWKLQ